MGGGTGVAVGQGVGAGTATVGCTGALTGSGVAVGVPGKQAARTGNINAARSTRTPKRLTLLDTLLILIEPYERFANSYVANQPGDSTDAGPPTVLGDRVVRSRQNSAPARFIPCPARGQDLTVTRLGRVTRCAAWGPNGRAASRPAGSWKGRTAGLPRRARRRPTRP